MFRTKCATISPTWTLSCQGSRWSMTIRSLLPIPRICVRFRANGSHQCVEPTGLYRRSNRYLAWSEVVVSSKAGYASATQRLTLVVRPAASRPPGWRGGLRPPVGLARCALSTGDTPRANV